MATKTIFLDRDGTMNVRIVDDYVKSWADWQWIEGALEAIKMLSELDTNIIIVTNQRGVSRVMTEEDLSEIHNRMMEDIRNAGGNIDHILFCNADRDANDPRRKPAPGMILEGSKLVNADMKTAWLVGDSPSDIAAANNASISSSYVGENHLQWKEEGATRSDATLLDFAKWYKKINQR